MLNRTLTASALAAFLLGLGMAVFAEEAQQAQEAQEAQQAQGAQAAQPSGPSVPPMMSPGMPFGPYGASGMAGAPYGPGGMPFGPYGHRGMMPYGPMGGPMMGRPGFMPPSGMGGAPSDQWIEERQRQIDDRLGQMVPQGRREYNAQRRQQRREQFERYATGAGMPMGGTPQEPTASGPWGEPTAPAVPSRSEVDERAQQLQAYGRSMDPYSSARRDYYQARRQYRKDAFERQMQAAQSQQGGMPYGMPGMRPGMMPYGPMGMGGPGMAGQNPWAPAPGEE